MHKTFGTFLIVLGLLNLMIAAFLVWQRNTPTRLSFKLDEVKSVGLTQTKRMPTILRLPSLHLELPIIPAILKDYKWQATPVGVSYLVSSTLPGETGNSIMYGHNWPNLLGRLSQVKSGDTLEVYFSDGTEHTFQIEFTTIVTPDETHILNQTSDQRLTLYTCTGFLDRQRFVVTAILKKNKS